MDFARFKFGLKGAINLSLFVWLTSFICSIICFKDLKMAKIRKCIENFIFRDCCIRFIKVMGFFVQTFAQKISDIQISSVVL